MGVLNRGKYYKARLNFTKILLNFYFIHSLLSLYLGV